jgi:hypothetical protein
MPYLRSHALDPVTAQEGCMNIWYFPIERLQTVKCEVCGRAFAHRSDFGRIERICRSCLKSAPEKRAA